MPTTPDNGDSTLRALYRSRSPEPPAALDDAIRAAAREAIATGEAARADRSADEFVSRPTRWRLPLWAGAAAAVGFAAVLLPGVLRQPEELDGSVRRQRASEVERIDPMTTATAREPGKPLEPAPSTPPLTVATRARADQQAASRRMGAPGPRAAGEEGDGAPEDIAAAVARDLNAADDADRLTFSLADAAPTRVLRFQGRFRPDSDAEEAITVTITAEAVIIAADWSAPAPCAGRLVVPHTATQVAVEPNPAQPAPVALRIVESDGSDSTVSCTTSGWFVERHLAADADR
jgi:hypothetical protein